MPNEPSTAVLALIRALELINAIRPVIDSVIANEQARTGLSRAELYALSKQLIAETDAITTEDMSDRP